MKTKVCPKCGEEKPLTGEFWYVRPTGKRFRSPCRKCESVAAVTWVKNNRKRAQKHRSDYRTANCDILSAKDRQYYLSHAETRRKQAAQWAHAHKDIVRNNRKKRTEAISDGYVIGLLKLGGLPITPDMIELKRAQITLFRQIKQYNEEERRLINEPNCSDNQEKQRTS